MTLCDGYEMIVRMAFRFAPGPLIRRGNSPRAVSVEKFVCVRFATHKSELKRKFHFRLVTRTQFLRHLLTYALLSYLPSIFLRLTDVTIKESILVLPRVSNTPWVLYMCSV
jgi:hypothetical protein